MDSFINLYNNSSVRRQDRLLSIEQAYNLLADAEFSTLSIVENENDNICGYGIPISFAWDKGNYIYFHCAPQGKKLTCIDKNPNVSLSIVGKTQVISRKFTTNYSSIIIKGTICRNLSTEEKMHALELILDKYSPEDKEIGLKYAEKSFFRTEILRMEIKSISGKCKNIVP